MSNTTADPLIGSTISQYDIVARIGGGGMGVVYKAIDTKLGRAVALKFLPPQWSHDEGAKQRFQREAQAASATNHRNICIIHDIEQTDDGRLFIVMAYYEGQTLKEKLEGGALPFAEALEIATETAEGLAKAHAQGVVHRDVKPGNLMITDDGVKVLDFGLAKFADSLQLTMPGSTIGTVAYMSPEQARGDEADARSDVWAIGVVLYEMLTGRVPFNGAYPEAIFHAIKNEPVPPLVIPLGGGDRAIPPAVEALVLRVLEKDPERRYQSARELARDLRLLQGRSVPLDLRTEPLPLLSPRDPARPLTWPQRVRRAVTPARAVAAMVAIAAIAGGTYAWLTRPVVRIPVAIAPVANHTGEPELDDYRLALTEALLEELEESPNIRVVPFRRLVEIVRQFVVTGDVSSREASQAVETHGGARFVVMPVLEYQNKTWLARAAVRDVEIGTVTKTYETEGVTSSLPKDAVYRLMASLADHIQADFKATGPGRLYTRRPASSRFRNLDAARAFAEGLMEFERFEYFAALAAFRQAVAQDGESGIAHAWSGRVLLMMFQKKEAVESARRAKQLVTADTPAGHAAFIEAIFAESQADFGAAEKQYRDLAALRPDEVMAQLELADFLKRQNREQEAISAYREALRRDVAHVRPHVDLCQLYTRVDEYPLAEQEAKSALEKYRAVGSRAGEAQALLALSELQRRQGKLEDAKRSGEEARDIFESLRLVYGLSRVYQYLGVVAGYSGDYRAAARLFEEALSRSREVGNRGVEGVVLNNLGVAHERFGQKTQALGYYQQSLNVYQENGDESRAAEQEANAASLLIDYGTNPAEALRRLRNAHATFQKLGHVEFEVLAREFEAASALHAGRHTDARQQLQAALTIAKDRRYDNRAVSMTVKFAESYFATSEYGSARKVLEDVATTDAGRDDREVAVTLGRVYLRLGDLDAARVRLERALTDVEASGQLSLLPTVHTALGELAYESGEHLEAREQFKKAESFWTDDLADVASVEARCHLGLIDAIERKTPTSLAMVTVGIDRATKMGRFYSETRCRLDLARAHVGHRGFAEALSALNAIPLDGERTLGRELQAHVHYWRSRALAGQGKQADAQAEATQAMRLLRDLQASLPADYRVSFASRRDIRPVIEDGPVRERR